MITGNYRKLNHTTIEKKPGRHLTGILFNTIKCLLKTNHIKMKTLKNKSLKIIPCGAGEVDAT
jgi:hypothetical protein